MSFTLELTAEQLCCSVCGITFYAPENWVRAKREKHDTFWCPNGHSQHFPHETEAEKLRRELAREKHKAEQAQAQAAHLDRRLTVAQRQRAAARGQVTKIKNRVGKGVCPCCTRSFVNLQQHMKHQHPEWIPEPVAGDEED